MKEEKNAVLVLMLSKLLKQFQVLLSLDLQQVRGEWRTNLIKTPRCEH